MIYPGPLTKQQRQKTQNNYCTFVFLNGVSYMCLGETIILLFAVKLNAPNYMGAALSAVIYFAYFMLPLGKFVAARVGAARSQAVFWTLRNITALGVAASAVTAYCGYPTLALIQIFIGACLFYGLRAAGIVMSQPLLGNMAINDERPHLIARSNALFYCGCTGTLLILWNVLRINDSVWLITGIIAVGACVGVTSTRYIRRMDESQELIAAARRPLMPEVRQAWRLPIMRKLVLAMFVSTLAIIMIGSTSVLGVKRGCGISDTSALYFSLIQFIASTGVSFFSGRIIRRFGSRSSLWCGLVMMFMTATLWLLAPTEVNYPYLTILFVLIGGANVLCSNGLQNYFLRVTPLPLHVAASMMTQVATSVGAGLSGMLISGSIFKLLSVYCAGLEPLSSFKIYFCSAFLLIALLSVFIWKLPPENTVECK